MSGLVSSISTSLFNIIGNARLGERKRLPANVESAKHNTVILKRDYHGKDIDEYRAKWGKEEGEAAFFHDNFEDERKIIFDNLFTFNAACLLWQYSLNNGTTSANSALPTPTLLTNGNSYLYVSDGNASAQSLTGTVSINYGSTMLTTSSGSSGLIVGNYFVSSADTSSQTYMVTAGSGTAWTISPAFGGLTISGVAGAYITAPSHSNTAVAGSTNIASQVCDSGFPANPSSGASSTFGVITGATNVSPIVLTYSGVTTATNDIVQVVEVGGNTNANGVFVVNPGGATSSTLLGSSGNSTYTSGGLITEKSVLTCQSTFGSASAVFPWYNWGLTNGSGSNKYLINNRVVGLGSKAGGTSSALKIGIGIS